MQIFIYPLIILIATTIGAISGIGGGVIIKPALQSLNMDNALMINFYSGVAVFVMSISSTLKHILLKQHIKASRFFLLGLGAISGGLLGETSFKQIYNIVGEKISVIIQMTLVIIALICALLITLYKIKLFKIKTSSAIVGLALILGWLATFLGIGGGPINVAFFILISSCTAKEAVMDSIAVIFFSQGAKLFSVISIGNLKVKYSIIVGIIIFAIVGGYIGAIINNKLQEKNIIVLFNIVVITVLVMDIFNIVKYL